MVVCRKARLVQTGSINTIDGSLRLLLILASRTSRRSSHRSSHHFLLLEQARARIHTLPALAFAFGKLCVLLAGSDFLHPPTAFIALDPAAAAARPLNKTQIAQYALPRRTQATAHRPEVHVPSSIIPIAYCGPSGSCATVTSLRHLNLEGRACTEAHPGSAVTKSRNSPPPTVFLGLVFLFGSIPRLHARWVRCPLHLTFTDTDGMAQDTCLSFKNNRASVLARHASLDLYVFSLGGHPAAASYAAVLRCRH